MATYGKKLLDLSGNIILPKTRSSLVYMDDNTTVESKIGAVKSLITNPNLLDNSNFTNFIIQRKVSGAITTAGYFINRWKLVSGTVTVKANSIVLSSGAKISQILEFAAETAALRLELLPEARRRPIAIPTDLRE